MSSAGDLAAAPPAQPPYDIVRSSWAELVVLDLAVLLVQRSITPWTRARP